MRSIGAFLVLGGQAASSLANFLTVLLMGRIAGQDDLGVYALGLSVYLLSISLHDTLVATPYTYYFTQKKYKKEYILAASVQATAAIGFAVGLSVMLICLLGIVSFNYLSVTLPVCILIGLLREMARRYLVTVGRYTALALADIAYASIQIGIIAVLALNNILSPGSAFAAIAFAGFCVVLGAMPLLKGVNLLLGAKRTAAILRDYFRYGKWLLLGGICHISSTQLYPWIAVSASGEALAGLYAACIAIANLVSPFLSGLTFYFRPKFMVMYNRLSQHGFYEYILKCIIFFSVPVAMFAVFLYFYSEFILNLLYGQSYGVGASAVVWMCFGMFAIAVGAPIQLALLAAKAPFTNLVYHGAALLLLLLASAFLWNDVTIDFLGICFGAINGVTTAILAVFLIITLKKRSVA